MNGRFRAPWGRELTALTIVGVALIAGAAAYAWWMGGAVVATLLLAPLAAALALMVRGYELAPGELRIRRLWWDTRWPLDGAVSARVQPGVMARSWRIWGNGGLFAISGHFSNAALGRYRAFVTDFTRTVVVKTPHGTIVVSPDRPAVFVAAVEEAGRRR